jgi:hypothetical protein
MAAGSDRQQHWDATYGTHEEFFGIGPSDFGVRAATVLDEAKVQTLLELGCGQGRDTLSPCGSPLHEDVSAPHRTHPGTVRADKHLSGRRNVPCGRRCCTWKAVDRHSRRSR